MFVAVGDADALLDDEGGVLGAYADVGEGAVVVDWFGDLPFAVVLMFNH